MGDPLYELVLTLDGSLADAMSGWLFESGVDGIEERDAGEQKALVVYSPDRSALEALASRARSRLASLPGSTFAFVRAEIAERESSSWQTEWTRHLRPELVGESFVVQPVYDRAVAPVGRHTIRLHPRLAFGVGSHATTRLAAASVERFCRAHPGCRVLDVGTGTGILGLVALLSGAAWVEATDVDPVAVDAARGNFELNGLADRSRVSVRRLFEIDERFALVAANLETPTLLEVHGSLVRVTAPAGRLVVSGVMTDRAGEVERALTAQGLRVTRRDTLDDWVGLELDRA